MNLPWSGELNKIAAMGTSDSKKEPACGMTAHANSCLPWSCSASGAVAARSNEIRRTFPRHENPYFDSERMATP